MNVDSFDDLVLTKAKQYITSETVKTMVSSTWAKLVHYEIAPNTPITINHIISIILYCDFSKYCTSFSSTFRALSPFESMESVKKRNSEFWWQSKLLRETVEIFGQMGYRDKDHLNLRNNEEGPYYSGVNCILAIPEFNIRLDSPTSTTKQIAVSMNFATREGMILQLDDTGSSHGYILPRFDVSWISRYPDEDERVFMG